MAMRMVLASMVLACLLAPCVAYAQDDDQAWNEITGLMNGLTAGSQQFFGTTGMYWDPAMGASGSQYLDALARWSWQYAQFLQSIDGAFGLDEAAPPGYDIFDQRRPNPLWQGLDQLQQTQPDVMRAYQNQWLFRGYQQR